MKKQLIGAMAGLSVLTGGCISLDVSAVQPAGGTAFTREEVLADPNLMEFVVAGVFVNFWGGAIYAQPWTVLSIYGEELTSSATSVPNHNRAATNPSIIWEHVEEPRQAFDNSLTGTSFFARDPWSNFYEANAAATDMPRLIRERNIRVIDPITEVDNTTRMLTFAKWIQGMSHVYLGLLFDSAAIVDTYVDLSKVPVLPFKPYQEVLDSGIKWLEEVIEACEQNTFLLPLKPDVWVYNTAFTNTQMAAVAHTYIARALVYKSRTPAELAQLTTQDWQRIKDHLDAGIVAPFGPMGLPNPLISMDYRSASTSQPQSINSICTSGGTNFCDGDHVGAFRVDLRLLGPADTSGAYQQWLQSASGTNFQTTQPFVVRTYDKRIQQPEQTSPLAKPVYFKYTDLNPPAVFGDTTIRGRYYVSNYWNSTRAVNNHTQFPAQGGGRNRRGTNVGNSDLDEIQDAMVIPAEVRLLKAEAEFRLGNLAAAAAIINETREINGELPGVTAAGVPASTPGQPCIPRRYDGSCGSLFDALMYEKRLETYGTAIAFFDARRWGCLLEGTLTQLPPPGRQLDLQGRVIYTFGGHPGEPGSAAKPTNCPLLHRP
jgi:hypothetical protein